MRGALLALLCAACMPGPVDTGAAAGDGCVSSAQCPSSFFCVDGACQEIPPDQCKSDRDCFSDMACVGGACVDRGSVGDDGGSPPDDGGVSVPPDDGGSGGGDPDAGNGGGTPDAGPPDAGPPVGVSNGDFESGALTGWTTTGIAKAVGGGHTGAYAAQVGDTAASHDSAITQEVLLPSGSPQLTFWYKSVCQDVVSFDWGSVTVTPAGGSATTVWGPVCSNNGAWAQATADLSAWAGQTVTMSFTNHDDGYAGDPTYTLYDDIAVASTAPDFTLSVSPASVSGAGSSAVSTGVHNGFSGSIVLSISGAPAGASAALSTTSVSPGSGATLTLSPGTAAGGTYSIVVTGTSGGLTHTASLSWTIAGAPTPDFSMSASPTTLSGTGTSAISVSAVNGFSAAVTLSVSGVPSGGSGTLSSGSVTGSGSSTLSLNVGTAAGGTYSVKVTGTSGSLSHSATVSWTVAAQVCTTDTWANYAHSFMTTNCTSCHSQFNTWSNVNSDRSSIQSRISSGNMPQGRTLSSSDKSRILKWLSCGLPQ